ncbi:hypothetical protein MLD38_001719 [Melastoma candidum]|uniref:Uncharacterized protein n=1 Tax=Melastoma candidum TaxID=119954 RepID=A0ACB9SFR1_9MYRT|nr:hypothetical protein MLD38_001719 [Melastoma candidum]
MDFGLEGLMVSAPDAPPDPTEAAPKVVGSGPFKHLHPSVTTVVEEWRMSMLGKTAGDISVPKVMQKDAARSDAVEGDAKLSLDTQHHPQTLSFSSSSLSSSSLSSSSSSSQKSGTVGTSHHDASTASPQLSYASLTYNRSAGFGSGNLLGRDMSEVMRGTRGPFTPSQWMELEHQALIYKYMTANIPVPSNLLIPIKKAFDSASFSCSLGGYLRSSPFCWGSFRLGFSNTGDPEPGRCRRTDGKKWRCSRDAVADQKYCEKHMNRGRHRSRKPVEGQNGHSVTGTSAAAHASSKMHGVTPASAAGKLDAAVPGYGASDSLATVARHQLRMKSLHPGVLSADASFKRFCVEQETPNDKKQNPNNLFPTMKQQSTYEDTSRQQFTLDDSYSLLDGTPCRSPHQFIDNWPENMVDRSAMSWSDTYLSISIPMASSDLISTTSSPTIEKANLLPLGLPRKSDTFWGSSTGGPLGEVLNQTGNIAINDSDSKNLSLLNLMKDRWDNNPSMGSSPRGVLQKTTFLSNSSGGSSPCPETNKSVDGINELLGSTLVNPLFSLPAL